jgi:hypothetical protein
MTSGSYFYTYYLDDFTVLFLLIIHELFIFTYHQELFEDVGPLVTSRLVRPGTAEVVYQVHKDAVKAVDLYHNRQLDGQPMKCMLVNSRPPSISSAARNSTRYQPVSQKHLLQRPHFCQ